MKKRLGSLTLPKVPRVIEEAKKAISEGCAVVIGLQTTGEAAADALGLQHGQVCGFTSTTSEMLQRFVTTHFPVRYQPNDQESKQNADKHPIPRLWGLTFACEPELTSVPVSNAVMARCASAASFFNVSTES